MTPERQQKLRIRAQVNPHRDADLMETLNALRDAEQRLQAAEADTRRLNYMEEYCKENVRGTDFPKWCIEGQFDNDCHQTLRQTIDEDMAEAEGDK